MIRVLNLSLTITGIRVPQGMIINTTNELFTKPITDMEPKLLKKKKKRKGAKMVKHTSTTFDQEQQITPSNFSFAVMKISVSQICQSVGYRATHFSALENLTHIAAKYLQAVAAAAADFTNASNRTQSNVFDIINGLHDLFSTRGFPGSSILHQEHYSVLHSSALTELANFVECTVETPFAKPIPRSSNSNSNSAVKLDVMEHKGGSISHIPKWLPPYPNATTSENSNDIGIDRRRKDEQLWENSVKSTAGMWAWEDKKGNAIEEQKKELRAQRERVRLKFRVGKAEGVEQQDG